MVAKDAAQQLADALTLEKGELIARVSELESCIVRARSAADAAAKDQAERSNREVTARGLLHAALDQIRPYDSDLMNQIRTFLGRPTVEIKTFTQQTLALAPVAKG